MRTYPLPQVLTTRFFLWPTDSTEKLIKNLLIQSWLFKRILWNLGKLFINLYHTYTHAAAHIHSSYARKWRSAGAFSRESGSSAFWTSHQFMLTASLEFYCACVWNVGGGRRVRQRENRKTPIRKAGIHEGRQYELMHRCTALTALSGGSL